MSGRVERRSLLSQLILPLLDRRGIRSKVERVQIMMDGEILHYAQNDKIDSCHYGSTRPCTESAKESLRAAPAHSEPV
jgi:hypothetical protein